VLKEVQSGPIPAFDGAPPEEQVAPVRVVRSELVLEELLAHEQRRDARCGQQQTHRDAAAAVGVPATSQAAADVDDA
jgi:hypothetical protein